jgi:gluconate 5-dehydrogenase
MADKLFDLEGRVALVTGSSGGLGRVLAEGLARNGVTVIINGRQVKKVEAVVDSLKGKGYDAVPSPFDVTRPVEIQKAAEQINALYGPPDIVINNAGLNLRHPLEEFPEEDWDTILNTNLKSAYLVSRVFVKPMIRKKEGKIINICSLQSELGRKTIAPYAASKGGLKMLTRAMAAEWAEYNIQVNGIGPGYFKTELTRPLFEDDTFDRWLIDRTPAGRWGEAEELVGTVLFLASKASSYINGQVIYVDGGITAVI